jgi:hypothetical protein
MATPAQTVTPELVEDLQQFQTDYRNQLTGAQPPQLSVLDMLRKRMATSMQDEQANRTADFGRALLASRSPNFFTALGEGLAAQEAGATSRMDRLRQIADAERQQQELETRQAAQRAEEDYRRQTIGLRERELAAGRRPNIITMIDPETRNAVLVNAETGQVVSRTPFRPMQELRNAPRPLSQAQIANIRQQVTRLASTDAGIVEGVTPTPAQITRRDELANQYFRDRLDAAAAGLLDFQGGGAGTATTGGAGAPAGTQPSQTLTYPRTP